MNAESHKGKLFTQNNLNETERTRRVITWHARCKNATLL